ncbi:MAG: Asp-tRNA(Asn)/Glu-tRNA(Gln) amidotransferase GatCAB subunit A, partial [Holophaga sp.]
MGAMTLSDWQAKLETGDLTSASLTEGCFTRMNALEPSLNAILHVNQALSLAAAEAADLRLRRGDRGPLLGI